jgi:hypothetical protein
MVLLFPAEGGATSRIVGESFAATPRYGWWVGVGSGVFSPP